MRNSKSCFRNNNIRERVDSRMGRASTPCCSYAGLNKGPWTPEEDLRLIKYIEAHGQGNWRTLPNKAGLQRCGKGCRLRWMNYLRPNVKRGHISPDEEEMIIRLHKLLGNRWSLIAGRIPGRTDNEVKNYWNTHLRKKFNAIRGLRRSAQTPCKETGSDKICKGGTTALYIKEKGSLCSKGADRNKHTVKDQNQGSACSHIGEIVSILQGAEELYNCRANVARLEAESIENLQQLVDGSNDRAINMDLISSTINHIHTAWPHPSFYLPSIYTPEFEPSYKTWPSDCMIAGLYHSMSQSVTSMQGHAPLQDNLVLANYTNSEEKPTGDVSSNMQPKTAEDPQIYTIPPSGFTMDEFGVDGDVFDQYGNMVLPEFDQVGQNMMHTSGLQAEYPKTDQCSEPWSSFLLFDCMERLYS